MIVEICTDNIEIVKMAAKNGARRVELCSALSVGGLTPSIGLIKASAAIKEIETHVMIRHREGSFVYDGQDIAMMLEDIEACANSGVKGVVFGCLTGTNEIHQEQTEKLALRAKELGLEVTFHRAFDFVRYPIKALEILIGLKIDRILTSGGKPTAIEGIHEISDLVQMADDRIQIMAGSGVNASNARELAQIGVNALHFTSHKTENSPGLGMGERTSPDLDKLGSIIQELEPIQ